LLLALSAYLLQAGVLTATTQTVLWCVIFFIASAAASSAYLTVSEIFPVEMRAQSISLIFSVAQGFGALGSAIFGAIIAASTREVNIGGKVEVVVDKLAPLSWGYVGAAAIMIIGGVVAWFLGVDAEGKSLEDIAPPISAAETPHVTPPEATPA
jgi:MFS family permease